MPQYFIDDRIEPQRSFFIRGDDFFHIVKVRRARPGSFIDVRDSAGNLHSAEIIDIDNYKNEIKLCSRSCEQGNEELNLHVYLSLVKSSVFDVCLQNAVEAGAVKIFPVKTSRSVADVDPKKEGKTIRWNRIAAEAAKQCYSVSVPLVEKISTFEEAAKNAEGLRLIAHPFSKNTLNGIRFDENNVISLFIGPEGGFSDDEIEYARAEKYFDFSSGTRVLRAETASAVISALVLNKYFNR